MVVSNSRVFVFDMLIVFSSLPAYSFTSVELYFCLFSFSGKANNLIQHTVTILLDIIRCSATVNRFHGKEVLV